MTTEFKGTNNEIIETVKQEMQPMDLQLLADASTGVEVLAVAEQYPNVLNSFIESLTNKVTKSVIYSKIFENPLKMLKKGKLEIGDSIEELFVQMALAKNFGERWEDDANTPEADLIRKLKPKVTAMYISTNFDKKYKTTTTTKQLRKAFTTEGGLLRLINQIVGSITSQAEYQEFTYTKKTLNSLVEKCENWTLDIEHKTETPQPLHGKVVKQTPYIVNCGSDARTLVKEIRTAVGDMKFPSTKFNLAKELNWCNPEDLVLITTSGVSADIDVNVLASAFNVSMADVQTRTILVDEMPKGVFKKTGVSSVPKQPVDIKSSDTIETESIVPKAILLDKDLFQIWDEFQGAGNFFNPDANYTNHFANREGIFAVCTFANMAIFY